MARAKKGAWPRSYSGAEKFALVTEIERRFRAGEGSLQAIASRLGTCEASYHNWTKAGIRPVRPVDEVPLRPVEVTALVPVTEQEPAAPSRTPLSLVAPGGYRLEGLSVESAAALLRALA